MSRPSCSAATVLCGGSGPQQSYRPDANPILPMEQELDNRNNTLSPCQAYDVLLDSTDADILFYFHDDVIIHDPFWFDRTRSLFANPECVCVGWGGAMQLGHNDMYKERYRLPNLARQGYASNQTDWKTHGTLEKGDKQVAVVDAFFMAVRTNFLRSVGGWPVDHITHHCLDLWLACEAARHKKQVWMIGVHCTHLGGGSSTKPAYQQARWLQGGTLEEDHRRPHRWLYEVYKDVLPIKMG